MSNELDKLKHSERRHRTQNVISKQMRIAKAMNVEVSEPHKLAKHHVLDCGVPSCPVCSSPRKRGELTIQEKRFMQSVGDE